MNWKKESYNDLKSWTLAEAPSIDFILKWIWHQTVESSDNWHLTRGQKADIQTRIIQGGHSDCQGGKHHDKVLDSEILNTCTVTMPGESKGIEEKVNHGQETLHVSLVPEFTVITSDEKSKIPGGNILELEALNRNTEVFTQRGDVKVSQTGLWDPDFPSSLSSATPLTLQATNGNASTSSSNSGQPEAEISSCCGSSHYSDSGSSSSTDLCNQRLSQLDKGSFEKTNNVSSLNFSQPNLDASESEKVQNNGDEDNGVSATDCAVHREEQGSSPPADFNHQARQTRDSIDVRWDNEEEDQRSMVSRRTVREGMCCCYQTFHRAFLQCVEETPAMLSGLVLSLAFCISIIVLIPTTGRVRPVCLCVRVCIGACA